MFEKISLLKIYCLILLPVMSMSCFSQKEELFNEKSKQVVHKMADSISSFYVNEEKSKQISEELKNWHSSEGKNIKNWDDFVKKVNKQLYQSSNDLHLKLYKDYDDSEDESDYEDEATKIFDSKSKTSQEIINAGKRV